MIPEDYKKNDPRMWFFYTKAGMVFKYIIAILVICLILSSLFSSI